MKILVTGSREVSPDMLGATRSILDGISNRDVLVIVGDAPGIDYQVVIHCDEREIPVECHGAYNKMRFKTWTGKNIAHDTDYLGRDRIMASLLDPETDECYAIWNGKSLKSGTIATARYAANRGVKVTWLYKKTSKWVQTSHCCHPDT